MTSRVHITVYKPHDTVMHVSVVDQEGKTVAGLIGEDGNGNPVHGDMAFALDAGCSEQSLVLFVEPGQLLSIGEPVGDTPSAEFAVSHARICELEDREKQAILSRASFTEQLNTAHARIAELETQLAAKPAATKRSK